MHCSVPARIGWSTSSEACRKAGSHGPVDGAIAEGVYPVGQRVALARVGVASCKHNGLQATVQLWQSHLHTAHHVNAALIPIDQHTDTLHFPRLPSSDHPRACGLLLQTQASASQDTAVQTLTARASPGRVRYLEGDLHRVYAQLGVQPLLSGLEHKGQRDQVGHVQLLQRRHSLHARSASASRTQRSE